MPFKIAVGSSEGVVIDLHFGNGKRFYIFELFEEGSFEFVEIRESQSPNSDREKSSCNSADQTGCSVSCNTKGHDDSHLLEKISLLSDCRAVLVYQIGKGAERLLISKGIESYEAKGNIESALRKLYLYYKRTKQIQ